MTASSPDSIYDFARLAVDKAKLCRVNAASGSPLPRVGVVIEKDGQLLGWAAKGCGGEFVNGGQSHTFSAIATEHAEESLLGKLQPSDLAGATVYVTLEPCTKWKRGASCAERLVQMQIAAIYIGNCDPNPDIGALAWKRFRENDIPVLDFPSDLRNEARRDNAAFFAKFVRSVRDFGSASFNYELNGGERILGLEGKKFVTRWTERWSGSIYALDYSHNVGVAKHCTEFSEVDDPGRWLEDSYYAKPVDAGQIVIFQNEHGFALIKVISVIHRSSTPNPEIHFKYELRY